MLPLGVIPIRCPAVVCPQTTRADIAKVQTGEGKLLLVMGIDRTSKFAVAQLNATADSRTAGKFPECVLKAVPYRIHTILTDRAIGTPFVQETMANGIQFTGQHHHFSPSAFRQDLQGGWIPSSATRSTRYRD